MSSPQRKTNTAAFTSALKQVFYIHKNIVAELCAQLDVVTDECKLLKANTHITKSSGKCESCIHLEKMNRSLQEHFNSLLQEKDTSIKTLEKKLQLLTGKVNTISSQTQKGKMLLKEMSYTAARRDLLLDREQRFSPKISDTSYQPSSSNDVFAPPLNPCSQEEINLCESELVKGHSKLRLTRHGKRLSRFVEEQRETKRAKISPGAAARSSNASDHSVGSKENNVSGLHETIFVADTVCNTQVRNFNSAHKNMGNDSDTEQSQQLLVVPETLAIDTSSNSGCEHETELEKQDDDDDNNPKEVAVCTERNYHSKGFLITSGGHDNRIIETEDVTLLNDDIWDVGNSNEDNTIIENVTLSKSLLQTTLSQAFTDKDRLIETGSHQRKVGHLDTEEKEKLQIAEAIRRSLTDVNNTQSSSKRSEDKSQESNFSELAKVKIRTTRKCNSTNEGKEIARNRLENSSDIAKLLPLSLQTSELKNREHGETTETTKSTERGQGPLNSANNNHKHDKISNFAVVEPNGSLNPEIHLTEYLDSEMTERQKVNQTFCSLDETIAPNLISQYMAGSQQNEDTSQITKLNTETNRCIQIHQNDNNATPKDSFWEDGDESIFNDDVFSNDEDDPELIEPSPQQTFQSRSQLYSSIPASSSSFKFIHKKPQVATKPVLSETGESEMINDEDSVMDESRHLLHEKSDLNLDRSTELDMVRSPPPQTLLDSFDKVPKSEDIEFPHVSVVRKRSERSKLQGFSCKQCYEYYKNSGLSEEALQQKKNECSRHRERYQAPETPEHFWSLGFPDTAEMMERRQKYDSHESPVAASKAPRRRQRLEKKF